MTSVPTMGEQFAKFLHHMGEAQSCAAMLAHLYRAQANDGKSRALADGWISISEMLKRQIFQVTKIAQGKLQ